jgi:cysteine synthase
MTIYTRGIIESIGNTPSLRCDVPGLPGCNVYVKLEGHNPSGSVKDRACVRMLQLAEQSGQLRAGMRILDATSGNMGCSMALIGRLLGYQVIVVANSKLTDPKRDFIRYFGADLRLVGNFTIEGNRYCRALATEDPESYCFMDQLHNWENPRASYETLGPEILQAFPRVALVVGSLGSGGSLLGVAQYFKRHAPGTRVLAVQAARGTRLPGTGSFQDGDYVTPFIQQGFSEDYFADTHMVSEREAVATVKLLRDQGLCCGLQTGGVVHAARVYAQRHGIQGDVVVIAGDAGWKNLDRLLAQPDLVDTASMAAVASVDGCQPID